MSSNKPRGGGPSTLVLEGVSKGFVRRGGQKVRALDGVSLTVTEGEFVVLLGPSGCGKTTMLRCIAGLETPDAGTIDICGRRVFSGSHKSSVPPNARPLNMMFQSYALWPHMSVGQNVGFPLRTRKVPRREISARVDTILQLIGISELRDQHPSQLSGGQQQRVALARALVNGDRLILFDEPLSNVDAKVREQLRVELLEMQRQLQFAAIYVTHDQQEAMELADRVVVLQEGRIAQVAPPQEIYDRPANRYVANFIGAANEIPGVVVSACGPDLEVKTDLGTVKCSAADSSYAEGDEVVLIWRPEAAEVVAASASDGDGWKGTLHETMFAGAHSTLIVEVAERLLRVVQVTRTALAPTSDVVVRVPSRSIVVMPAGEPVAPPED